MLSIILSGEPYRHPGSSPNKRDSALPLPSRDVQDRDVDTTILALHSLGTFDFTGCMVQELIRECASTYLEDDNPNVRRAAAITSCQLLVRDPVNYQVCLYWRRG